MRTKVILDAGSNWDKFSDWEEMLEFAQDNGCILKGQLWKTDRFVKRSNKNYAVYKDYEVPRAWVKKLACPEMMWTPFDADSLLFLKTEINPEYYKVACLDSNQKWLIDSIGRTNKHTFISCGVYGLEAIRQAVKWFDNIHKITLMHCIVSYKPHDFQLGYFKDRVNGSRIIPWGVSLNYPSTILPAVAVGIGGTAVEVHFKLDHIKNTPDAPHSMTKAQVVEMIRNIKEVEENMGNNERPLECERVNILAGARGKDGRR